MKRVLGLVFVVAVGMAIWVAGAAPWPGCC